MTMNQKRIHLLSCVGTRPLALVSPTATLMAYRGWSPESTTITLLTKKYTSGHGKTASQWLSARFPGLNVRIFDFDEYKPCLQKLIEPRDEVYFNTNPGMNWQIAFVSQHLPVEKTFLFGSDYDRLYLWPLGQDIAGSRTQTCELGDLGMEGYNVLSPELHIDIQDRAPSGFSCTKLRERICRNRERPFFALTLTGESRKRPSVLNWEEIMGRLLWVRERRGMLYLLFDLQPLNFRSSKTFCSRSKDCPAYKAPPHIPENHGLESRNLLRLVMALFSPLSYIHTIVTNEKALAERCFIEGIDCIFQEDQEAREYEIEEWIAGRRLPAVKSLLPPATLPATAPPPFRPSERQLFVCVGDNPDTTLQAAQSHQPASIRLFYDAGTPRIKDRSCRIQEFLRQRYPETNVALLPTDHLGRGIMTTIARVKGNFAVNVTPGTKWQGVALALAARRAGAPAYSIVTTWSRIENIQDRGDSFPVVSTKIEDLLAVQPLFVLLTDRDTGDQQKLWRFLLAKLNTGELKQTEKIQEITIRSTKEKAFVFTAEGMRYAPGGPLFAIEEAFFTSKGRGGGYWWEMTTAQAIADRLPGTSVYTQVSWQRPGEKEKPSGVTYSEMDVVFPYGNNIVAVSCKTGRPDLETEAFLIHGEAERRFGRMTLACIAVPANNVQVQGKKVAGEIINKSALILTPSILADTARLRNCLEKFIASLRTTT